MILSLNQLYELLSCVHYEVTHKERELDQKLTRELIVCAKLLPMQGAVFAIDTILLSPSAKHLDEKNTSDPRNRLLHQLPGFTIQRSDKIRYTNAVCFILEQTLPKFVTTDTIPLEERLIQLRLFLMHSTVTRPLSEIELASETLANIMRQTPAHASKDRLFTACIGLLNEIGG